MSDKRIMMINEALGHPTNVDSVVKAGIDVYCSAIHSVEEYCYEWMGPMFERWANYYHGVLVPLSGRPCPHGYCGAGNLDNRRWFADLVGVSHDDPLMEHFDNGCFSGLAIAKIIHDFQPTLPVFVVMDIFPAPKDAKTALCDAVRKIGAVPVPPVMDLPRMIRVIKTKWKSMEEIAAAIFELESEQI